MDAMALGTNVSAERTLSWSIAHIWSRVRTGVAPGGLIGEVKAMLFVEIAILKVLEEEDLDSIQFFSSCGLGIELYYCSREGDLMGFKEGWNSMMTILVLFILYHCRAKAVSDWTEFRVITG